MKESAPGSYLRGTLGTRSRAIARRTRMAGQTQPTREEGSDLVMRSQQGVVTYTSPVEAFLLIA